MTTENDSQLLQRLGTSGLEWAKEFNKIAQELGYPKMDEGWLIGWFANAIESGRAAGMNTPSMEALGWAWAEACTQLDAGKDPRKYDQAELIERAKLDLFRGKL